jgi:hypothetical protein
MSDDMARKTGTELGKPSPTLKAHRPSETAREEPFYKATKGREVGRVADEAVVLMMFCESRTEGRVSAGTQ